MNIEVLSTNAEQVSKLHQAITMDLPEYFGLPEFNERYSEGVMSRYSFVARVDGEYVGLLSLDFPYPNNANIYWMGVLKEYHGKGVGSMLIEHAAQYASDQKATTITVETLAPYNADEFYLKTFKFYENCGFHPLHNLRPEGSKWDMVYMVKYLN